MSQMLAASSVAQATRTDLAVEFEATTRSKVVTFTSGAAKGLVLFALLAAPWAFGAVQVWAWATLTVLAFTALLLWAASKAAAGRLCVVWSPLYVPGAFFLALGLVQYYGHLTFDPVGTREALIKLSTDLVFFFLVCQFMAAAGEKLWRRLGLVVTLYAFALALFAILQFFSSPRAIYWSVAIPRGGFFGPYVNHNHYAGLMEMLIPLAVVFVISETKRLAMGIALGFLVIVPVASLVLSGSRGGLLSLWAEILIFATVWTLLPRSGTLARKTRLIMATGVVSGVLFLFWLVPSTVVKHLATLANLPVRPEVTLGFRAVVAHGSLQMIRAHPYSGSGLGSFLVVYPQFNKYATDLVVDHAHDDYLELLAETGFLGSLIALSGIGLFLAVAFKDLGGRLEGYRGRIQFAAALGCCGLLVHSFSDFNFHIPANAAWFVVLLSIATRTDKAHPLNREA